jgi:hypothetical protein
MATRKRSSLPPASAKTTRPRTSHKYPWDNFTVTCEVGKLVYSFVPAPPNPEGFIGPFQRRLEEYLGLHASANYEIKSCDDDQGLKWVVCYWVREDEEWIQKTEVLQGCTTEEEATIVGSERMMEFGSTAEQAGVFFLANLAAQEFLSRLPKALKWALDDLVVYSCNYPKLTNTDTSMAKRREKEKGVLPTKGVIGLDDDSQMIFPTIRPRDMMTKDLKLYRDRIKKLYGVSAGGDHNKPKFKWTLREEIRFARQVNQLRPLWDKVVTYFEQQSYDPGCSESVKKLTWFQSLSKGCSNIPEYLLNRVYRRKSEGGEKLWPLAFTLEHASLELDIINSARRPFSFWTLKPHYEKGNAALIEDNA